MKLFASTLAVLFGGFSLLPAGMKTESADIIFKNGNFYTVNEAQPKLKPSPSKAAELFLRVPIGVPRSMWITARALLISRATRSCPAWRTRISTSPVSAFGR